MFSRLQTEMYRITLIGAELQIFSRASVTLPGKVVTEEGYRSRLQGHKCCTESEQDAVEARSRKLFKKREFMGDKSTPQSWIHSLLRKTHITDLLGSGRMPQRKVYPVFSHFLSFSDLLIFGKQSIRPDGAFM